MNYLFTDMQKLLEALAPVITFLFIFVAGLSLRSFLFGRLARWAQGTKTEVDDIIISSLRGPFLLWCLMLGIYFSLKVSFLRDDLVQIAGKILLILGIISAAMAVSSTLPVTSLTQHITRIIVFGAGIMIILNSGRGVCRGYHLAFHQNKDASQ
ncbi:MAG: hypothetical protein WC335_08125 [Candidatus Omnitrophota bacterium]|jgi:cobalamin biosynthesis protein CobD/CbiB